MSKRTDPLNFFNGQLLEKSEILILEDELEQNPEDLEKRYLVSGYYRHHEYCCIEAREQRRKHNLWLVDNAPLDNLLCGTLLKVDPWDSKSLELIASHWRNRLDLTPSNYFLMANFAQFIAEHQPEESEKYFKLALQVKPNDKLLKERFSDFLKNKDTAPARAKSCTAEFSESIPVYWDGIKCDGGPTRLKRWAQSRKIK